MPPKKKPPTGKRVTRYSYEQVKGRARRRRGTLR